MDTLILNANGMPLSLVPLSVIPWTDSLRLVFLEKVRVIKSYENWTVRSQHLEIPVPSIVIMTEQVKFTKAIKYSSNNVFLRDDFTCQLQSTWRCQEAHGKVRLTDLTLDHVVPRSKGGKTSWLNCCAACKECNSQKGSDETVLPIKAPYKPNYFELLNKRKKFPIYIRDPEWAHYVDWPEDLIKVANSPDAVEK
jgi:5-methylcytosine-specific restriction endonuclease McrA